MKQAKINLILSMLIFGSIGLFRRMLPFYSGQIAFVRGAIGAVVLLLWGVIGTQKIEWSHLKKNAKLLIFSGIAIGINWILLFESYRFTTVSNATICYYFAPVIVMILSPVVLKERLRGRKVLCILVAMVGLCMVASPNEHNIGTNDTLGILLGLGAAVFYACVILLNKRFTDISGVERTFVQLGVAALSILPYTLLMEPLSWMQVSLVKDGTLLLIVGVIHTAIAYLLYFSSMKKLNAQTIATFSYVDPISAIVLAAIFLQELPNVLQIIGGMFVLGATFFAL